ncbi:MAG: hypothetical protein J6Q54_07040 [Oscillospiraceae bacterium]|nr:hypothetical protein [Oscillospiraceae bacterium]
MTKEMLFLSMEGIDDDILEESEAAVHKKVLWKKLLPLTACLVILLTAALSLLWLLPEGGVSPQVQQLPPPANGNWTLTFYEDSEKGFDTQITTDISFYEALSDAEMEAVLPQNRPEWLTGGGRAGFNKTGRLRQILLQLDTSLRYGTVNVNIAKEKYPECVIYPTRASVCNGVTFNAYAYKLREDITVLSAKALINDYWFTFRMEARNVELDAAKEVFKQTLESFTYYAEPEKPLWEAVAYSEIPEPSCEEEIPYREALEDPAFGAYLPATGPDGAELVACRRYTSADSSEDSLRIVWKIGENAVRWEVSLYDPETTEAFLTSVYDRNRICVNSYCVFDSRDLPSAFITRWYKDKTRFQFGVKYAEVLIQIESQNAVCGQWGLDQLEVLGIVEPEGQVYEDRNVEWYPGVDYQDPVFGAYVPRISYESGTVFFLHRYRTDNSDYMDMKLDKHTDAEEGFGKTIYMRVTHYEDQPMTDVADRESYSLLKYRNPWDPRIPEEDRRQMERPIFNADDLTTEVLQSRIYYIRYEETEPRMEFGVRYGDAVIYVFASGFTAEEVFDTIKQIQQ